MVYNLALVFADLVNILVPSCKVANRLLSAIEEPFLLQGSHTPFNSTSEENNKNLGATVNKWCNKGRIC